MEATELRDMGDTIFH